MKFITVVCNNLSINIPLFGLPYKYIEETFKKMQVMCKTAMLLTLFTI